MTPVSFMIRIVTYLFIQLGFLLGSGISNLIVYIFQPRRRSKRLIKADKTQALQNAKFSDCRQAVLSFAQSFGYMTREIMSPQEVEQLINSGITGQGLTAYSTAKLALGHFP